MGADWLCVICYFVYAPVAIPERCIVLNLYLAVIQHHCDSFWSRQTESVGYSSIWKVIETLASDKYSLFKSLNLIERCSQGGPTVWCPDSSSPQSGRGLSDKWWRRAGSEPNTDIWNSVKLRERPVHRDPKQSTVTPLLLEEVTQRLAVFLHYSLNAGACVVLLWGLGDLRLQKLPVVSTIQ